MSDQQHPPRPSTWVMAGTVGLAAAATVILADYDQGTRHVWPWYLWLGVFWAAGALGLIHFGWGLVYALWWFVIHWPETPAEPPADETPPGLETVTVLREVETGGGGTVEVTESWPAHKLEWRAGYLLGLAWAEKLGGVVTSPAMLRAGAFRRGEDWQAWANACQANGWLDKAPGVAATLTLPLPDIRRKVRAGAFTAPSSLPPAIAELSKPFRRLSPLPPSGDGDDDGDEAGGAGEAEPGPAAVADAAGRERALRALVGAGRGR